MEPRTRAVDAQEWEEFAGLAGSHFRWQRRDSLLDHDLVDSGGTVVAEIHQRRGRIGLYDCQIAIGAQRFETRTLEPGRFSLYGKPKVSPIREVSDAATGVPLLRIEGVHWNHNDGAVIGVLGGTHRSLRCSVSSHRHRYAVMTASDDAGNWVVKFRRGLDGRLGRHECVVTESERVSTELMCVMTVATQLLPAYFYKGRGGF